MITNVLTESSDVLCFGNNSTQIITNSFSVVSDGNVVSLKGVVSRKNSCYLLLWKNYNSRQEKIEKENVV